MSVGQIGVEGSGQDVLIGLDCSLSAISKRDDSGVSGGAQRVFNASGVWKDRLDGGDVI